MYQYVLNSCAVTLCYRLLSCFSHRPEHGPDDGIHSLQQLVAQLLAWNG